MKYLFAVLFLAGCLEGTTLPADATTDQTADTSADAPVVDSISDVTVDQAEVVDSGIPFDASGVSDAFPLQDVSVDARSDAFPEASDSADARD